MVKHNCVHRLFKFLTRNITVRKRIFFTKEGTVSPSESCPGG